MTARPGISVARFARDEAGATLVEFGLAIVLMLLIFFGLIDFGRMAFHYVAAEKAVQSAVRVAAVRPPACAGVPDVNQRGSYTGSGTPPRYGTTCSAATGICANPGTISCTASQSDPTSQEVWGFLQATLPLDATEGNVVFRYSFDPALGFLGGPYVPVVTVELTGLQFQFVSPLGALAALAIGASSPTTDSLGGTIAFPALSASVPGEDLAQGMDG